MPRIERNIYHQAMLTIIREVGYRYQDLGLGKLIVIKNERKIYIEIAGKNLPYFGINGEEAFAWETYIRPERLVQINSRAKDFIAEPWLAFCYAILNTEYKLHFKTIVTLDKIEFGVRLIRTSNYSSHMKLRSPSWSVVDLPRKEVIRLTCDPEDI